MAESPEVHDRLESIRREGYTLNLFLDCKRSPSDKNGGKSNGKSNGKTNGKTNGSARRPLAPPTFRIDGRDLAFLRSVGIDPTRQARSRRSRQTPTDAD